MHAYRVETTIQQDGSLVVRDLPLRAGEEVEVIILVRPPLKSTHHSISITRHSCNLS